MCKKAICKLCQLKTIHLKELTDKIRYISVNSGLLKQIAHDKNHRRWKIEALKIILYAFSINRHLKPLHFYSIVMLILSQLKYILSFLNEIDVEQTFLVAYVIEICLLVSCYLMLD